MNSLLGFGTGSMPDYWNMVKNINIPALLIAGANDEKFVTINKKLHEFIKHSQLEIINDCGHNVHLEKESEFVILVNNFLKTL